MSDLEELEDAGGVARKLGCLVPASFPTAHRAFADEFRAEMMTLDEVRATLAQFNERSMYGRRERFAGKKYVRNQLQFGACNGWSVAGRLSRMRELRGEPYVCLSGADAYSQMNGGQDNGSTLSDGVKVCFDGIAPEDMAPADRIYTNQISAAAKAARSRFRGFLEYACDTEEELATALVLGRLCVIAVHATNSFSSQDGDGVNLGVNGPGNHSVGADDIRLQPDGTLNYDMGNSWDVTFCDGGYTWLTWARHLRETVKYHRFFALVSTGDDDKDSSIPPKVKG